MFAVIIGLSKFPLRLICAVRRRWRLISWQNSPSLRFLMPPCRLNVRWLCSEPTSQCPLPRDPFVDRSASNECELPPDRFQRARFLNDDNNAKRPHYFCTSAREMIPKSPHGYQTIVSHTCFGVLGGIVIDNSLPFFNNTSLYKRVRTRGLNYTCYLYMFVTLKLRTCLK